MPFTEEDDKILINNLFDLNG